MKKNVKLVLLSAVLALLGGGLWKAWSIYKVVQGIRENVPGVSMVSDGINLVKEDSQGNKFNVKIGPNGLSIVGSKDGKPVEIKVDAAGMQVGRDGKQFQIPIEELKEQLKLIKGAKKESVE